MDAKVLKTASYLVHRYKTRNPFDIIAQRDIDFDYTYRYAHLLGYYCVLNGERFIRLNGDAPEQDLEEAAQHELSHDVLDYRDACRGASFKDTYFYSRSCDYKERRANLMTAEVLIKDEDVLEPIGYYKYKELYQVERQRHPQTPDESLDYYVSMEFGEQCGSCFLTIEQLAKTLGRNLDLLEYKIKALLVKGYDLPITPELKTNYLKR